MSNNMLHYKSPSTKGNKSYFVFSMMLTVLYSGCVVYLGVLVVYCICTETCKMSLPVKFFTIIYSTFFKKLFQGQFLVDLISTKAEFKVVLPFNFSII